MGAIGRFSAEWDSGIRRALGAPKLAWEISFLSVGYLIAGFFALSTISLCGPGCCFAFFTVLAVASGLFMLLRRAFYSRVFCLVILLLSLVGMWHEKQARDSWAVHDLQQRIQEMQNTQQAKTH
jgi:membrane protein implicated in regulation of membrane protease activity